MMAATPLSLALAERGTRHAVVGLPMIDAGIHILLVLAYDDHIHAGVLGRKHGLERNTGTDVASRPSVWRTVTLRLMKPPLFGV